MSLGICPVFNPPLQSARLDADGSALMRFFESLDALAAQRGLRPISSFGDPREVPEDYDGDPSDLDDVHGPWEDWFSPADGLASVSGLRQALQESPSAVGTSADAEWVLSELQALETALQAASSEGALFRLEVLS